MDEADVIIIGGGLAGLSAAYELTKQKKKVLLLEAREVIGGRTSSWKQDGMPVESGLHRYLGYYTALPRLLKACDIDLDKMLFWEDEVEIITPDGGPRAVFGASVMKPIKSVASFMGNNDFLSPKDKASLLPFFTAALKDFTFSAEELDTISVAVYAKKHGVTKQALQRILVPATSGIFFLPPEKYSMYVLAAFFAVPKWRFAKMRVGAFMGGMTEVMCLPIGKTIEKNRGMVKTNTPVQKLLIEHKAVVGVIANGKKIRAKHVIVAASLAPAQEIIRQSFTNTKPFQKMLQLTSMPTVTIQCELKRRSMEMDRTTFGPGTCWASFAEQSQTTFRHVPGRLSIILTSPAKYLKMTDNQILKETIRDGKRLGIDIEDAITDFRVIRIPMDFYSLEPGNEQLRPPQKTAIPGLTLAGDYTKQPYLGTMEGAVRSGKLAAEQIIQ